MTTSRDEVAGIVAELYRAYNARDIDGSIAHLGPGVDWPDAATGGRLKGRAAVRERWLGEWRTGDPRAEPMQIDVAADGTVRVRVDRLVRDLTGRVTENLQEEHVYTFDGAFITRMTVLELPPENDDEEDEDDED